MEDTKMEQALRNLLDFQRFAQNKRLNALITQTELAGELHIPHTKHLPMQLRT